MTEVLKDKPRVLEHICELLNNYWQETKDSVDDDGQFAIALYLSVLNGAPAKINVKCNIHKTIIDEPERSGDSQQMLPAEGGEAEAKRDLGR